MVLTDLCFAASQKASNIQLLHEPRVLLNILEPQFRLLAHQALDQIAGLAGFVLVYR